MKISVHGLGNLGLPIAERMASKMNEVVMGYDPAVTPQAKRNLVLSNMLPRGTDIAIIVVPTPSLEHGDFDPKYVEQAIEEAWGGGANIAVVVSTVSPGTMDYLAERYESESFSLVYAPTFVALGTVARDLLSPDLMMFGGRNPHAVNEIRRLFDHVFGTYGTNVHVASFTEIELLKISVNCFLVAKITMANSLGYLFEQYGVNPRAVEVIGSDHRIGNNLLRPGGPVGGPCLPRDTVALLHAANEKHVAMPMVDSLNQENSRILWRIRNRVLDAAQIMRRQATTIGVLGTSYKYGTTVEDSSVGSFLVRDLSFYSFLTVSAYDATIHPENTEALKADVIVVTQPEYDELVESSDKIIVRIWVP